MNFTGKGKTTEGKGLTGYPLARKVSLENPSMLLPSKPLPPIRKSSPSTKPNKMCSGEQENGKKGIGSADDSRKSQELSSEGKRHKASLLYSSGGNMKKGSLGPPLIPPIHKAVSPHVGSAAGSLSSSLQLDVQESQEMRPRTSSRMKEKNSEHAGLTGNTIAKRSSQGNPSMILPSKPLPPIRKSSPSTKPNKMCSGEQENGKKGIGSDDDSRKSQELSSEGKRHKASLLYSSGGNMKKGSLGPPLIPPIHKAVSPHVGSAAGSLSSSLQLDVQESQEMRPRTSSRMKEKNSEHAGLTGNTIAKRSSQGNPSMILPSKPLPPIRKSSPSTKPNKMCSGEQENGKKGIGSDDDSRKSQELSSEGKRHKASLLYSSGGNMKKGSLGPPLIPPIHKAVSPHVGSAAGSLSSSLQLDVQESQEMRPRTSSRMKEKNSEHAASSESTAQTQRTKGKSPWCVIGPGMPLFPRKLAELFSMETYVRNPGVGNGGLGSRPAQGDLAQEPRQRQLSSAGPRVTAREEDKGKAQHGSASHRVLGHPLSQAKEPDHPSSPGLTSDLRDGFGKIRAALCKLAVKNLEPKDVEVFEKEMKKRREEKISLQLPPQTVETRDAAEASFSLPPVNDTPSSVQRKHPGSALKKKVLRKQDKVPLLPGMSIIHEEGSVPCNSSVTSQTATGSQRREELLRGHGHKDTACPDPQQSLLQALSLLRSDDWEMKEKGLVSLKHLAGCHSTVLLSRLRDICLAVTNEVTNLRSKVSHSAIVTLGEFFAILKKDMDPEVDEVVRVILQMLRNSPEFVEKAASQTLGIMVENVTPARAMTALLDSGVKSRHVQVRKCAAELLLSLLEKIGVTELAVKQLSENGASEDNRAFAKDTGSSNAKNISKNAKDVQEIEEQKGERPSVKSPVKKRSDGSKKPQATLSSSQRLKSTSDGRLLHRPKAQVALPPAMDETETLQKLYNLLEAKGFETRMEGVALLLDLCKTSPKLVATNIVQIFDYFVLRLSDTHKRVKQMALDVLAEIIVILEDAMNPVIIRLVEGITRNLNSKDPGVHATAVNALEVSIAHLDKVSLMKEFSHQWSQLSGQALLDVTERITELVEGVHARSPEVIQRYALPVLWSLLENKALPVRSANVRMVVTRLASALYEVMGTKLKKCAASQPPHVWEKLSSILGW
ncbi:TOG array regulator of axonemal microtubules protein 2-like [Oenanthe melanoleuca]|uniref:TOG array regulator of axonemal microtubules protein 2-like n=1 Tax=Oenanthe melanoleuca TaxID=2939378 RepID=UPI0024C177AD|nr:TOG array regulator of axonemal microtubules protein 2-like [Oenanthe melanoleuca]